MSRNQIITKMACGAALLPLIACTPAAVELEPAATAQKPRGLDDAAMANQQGVQVTAQADDWPGAAEIENEVTPLRVIVQNQSREPIQVRYSSFKVTAPDGSTYSAVPPYQVGGVVEYESYGPPAFGYTNFYVAPYYGAYYPDIDPYAGPFDYDAGYYNTYYGYWADTTVLPTTEMLVRALPEGVIQSGGSLDGYLYFQKVNEPEGTNVTLHADLKQAKSDEAFVALQLPFVVD